ncbi:hypothetical protein [Clostridium cibarium]|uniref:Tetratricopeptide repeat protein n=1 Tax=Clostridium cibarium TaxID=2762247 RepID=A0ABR8PZ93_9CLOT|nr:hypothetical protein [Clostridium cibarium]MBD7913478.1 hypothetical protein [Clostridium cibarium]
MNIEDEIEHTVVNEVFKLFKEKKFKEAKDLLYEIYLNNYENLIDLSIKRLLIHNLAWAENCLGEISNAEQYILQIKSEIEDDPDYINNNLFDYCLILNLYCEIFKDELSIDEYKEINLFVSNYHHENGSMGREYIALTNVYKVTQKWDDIISLLLNLKKHNANEYFINEILRELEKNNIEAFDKAYCLLNGGEIYV